VIDFGATDHMTYSNEDFSDIVQPRRKIFLNVNGVSSPITRTRDVNLTQLLCLKNTLLVPNLSTKLISVGQLTEDLNYVVLMYPNFCIFSGYPHEGDN
jgi:hypothetical protein